MFHLENEITIDTLPSLTNDLIKEMVPKIGVRVKLVEKIKQYKSNLFEININGRVMLKAHHLPMIFLSINLFVAKKQ